MICPACQRDAHHECDLIPDPEREMVFVGCDCLHDAAMVATLSKAKAHALRGVVLLNDYDKAGAADAFRRALAELYALSTAQPRGRLRLVREG